MSARESLEIALRLGTTLRACSVTMLAALDPRATPRASLCEGLAAAIEAREAAGYAAAFFQALIEAGAE